MGDGFFAGSTPSGPKVKKNNFAFKLGKGDLLTVKGLQGEVGG
jgi:hypothetical protein